MRGYRIHLGGFYGKVGAVTACFVAAVYIVPHSAKIAWDADMRCIVWPLTLPSLTPLLPIEAQII